MLIGLSQGPGRDWVVSTPPLNEVQPALNPRVWAQLRLSPAPGLVLNNT